MRTPGCRKQLDQKPIVRRSVNQEWRASLELQWARNTWLKQAWKCLLSCETFASCRWYNREINCLKTPSKWIKIGVHLLLPWSLNPWNSASRLRREICSFRCYSLLSYKNRAQTVGCIIISDKLHAINTYWPSYFRMTLTTYQSNRSIHAYLSSERFPAKSKLSFFRPHFFLIKQGANMSHLRFRAAPPLLDKSSWRHSI